MSKYKPLTEPITRREACLILDRKRFDGAVRSGDIKPLGKRGSDGIITNDDAPLTSPLLFDQAEVREYVVAESKALALRAKDLRLEAKEVAKRQPPLTRRQVAEALGKRLTGILIRSGQLAPDGVLTDTQTAAHTYNPLDVATVVNGLADQALADSKALAKSAKVRVPA